MTDQAAALTAALQDRYRIERELGHGGMATVYLAWDLRHDRLVALKVMRPELAATLGPDRFLREIHLAAGLTHQHILPVFDSGTADGVVYYVMPYVQGESLRDRLKREVQLPVDAAVGIVARVAAALDHAHRHGIIHRDIKPENILLQEDGSPVLADFGIAVATTAADESRLTATGLALGTPAYMSPEQSTGDHHLDGRSDIYSLGCVLYELLVGEPPFTGPTAQAVIARRFAGPAPRVGVVRESVPPAVDEAIARAIARVPADRFATAGDFAIALTAPATTPRRRRPPRVAGWAAILALAALAVAGILRWRSPAAPPADPNLLAVAPFDVLDPALELWREGLADVLSRNLDGAGPVRTVPPSVALRRWSGRADRASAEALGRRTGAGVVVFGTAVPRGRDSVSLRAGVLDGSGPRGQTDVEISGPVARIGELADSLAFKVLQALARSRPIASTRRVSLGATSLPALKAFLQGEQFYRRGAWDSAAAWYDQAITADSTFALAHDRMGLVLSWSPPSAGTYPDWPEFARRAMQLNHGLAPRESLLIEGWSDDDTRQATATAALEEAVRRYPDDPEVWYRLADARHHRRAPPPDALEAFNRAIELDSGFAPAYEHTVGLSLRVGRPDLAAIHAARRLELEPTGQGSEAIRLAAAMLAPGEAGSAEAARLIDSASIHAIFTAGLEYLGSFPDSGESAIRLFRRIGAGRRRPGGSAGWVLDSLMWPQYLARALAFRGHLREAYETDQLLLRQPEASAWSWFMDPFLELALLDAVPDSVARVTFARALDPDAAWSIGFGVPPRHLQGLAWWLARGDTVSLSRMAERAGQVARRRGPAGETRRAELIGAVAAAYLALARGDSLGATQRLAATPDSLCLLGNDAICLDARLTLARLHAAQGEHRRAAGLLDALRWERGGPGLVLTHLERGRVAERLGEREKAIESYGFVTAAWHRADPVLQPYVTEARRALQRVRAE